MTEGTGQGPILQGPLVSRQNQKHLRVLGSESATHSFRGERSSLLSVTKLLVKGQSPGGVELLQTACEGWRLARQLRGGMALRDKAAETDHMHELAQARAAS